MRGVAVVAVLACLGCNAERAGIATPASTTTTTTTTTGTGTVRSGDALPAECSIDADIGRIMNCDAVAVGSAYITRAGAGLDDPAPPAPRAVFVDVGGPGAPWERGAMMDLFEPLRAGGADVYIYREPWTVAGISDECAAASRELAAPVLSDGPLTGVAADFVPCLSTQQTIADYTSTVDEVVRRLTEQYRKVDVVGFSFGATRLRYVLPSLAPGTSVDFIEPGPHPGSTLESWAGDRVRAAMRLIGDRCGGGDAIACQVVGTAGTAGTDAGPGRRARELAALYWTSHPEVTGRSVVDLARLSLSVNADGEIQSPGIGFLAGMCRQVDVSATGDDAYSQLVGLCPGRAALPTIDGGASACVRANPTEPLVGVMPGWSDDPDVSTLEQISVTPFHGALFSDLVDQQRIECPT